MTGRTALYRLYDAAETLLYIGISEHPEERWRSHASDKPWWRQVARKSVRWFDSRPLAEAAEDSAIATERTPHNVAGSPWAPKPRELQPDEMLISDARANLTELVTSVRMQDRAVRLVRPTRARLPQVGVVPADVLDLIDAVGGLNAAREALRAYVANIRDGKVT